MAIDNATAKNAPLIIGARRFGLAETWLVGSEVVGGEYGFASSGIIVMQMLEAGLAKQQNVTDHAGGPLILPSLTDAKAASRASDCSNSF